MLTSLRHLLPALFFVLLPFSTTVNAEVDNLDLPQTAFYGVDYEMLNYSVTGSSESTAMTSVRLKIGQMFTSNWGIEAQLGMGLNTNSIKTSVDINNDGTKDDIYYHLNIGHYFSVAGVGRYQLTNELSRLDDSLAILDNKFTLFGKVGLSNVQLVGEIYPVSSGLNHTVAEESKINMTFYGGISYQLTKPMSIDFEVKNIHSRDDLYINGVSLGVTRNF